MKVPICEDDLNSKKLCKICEAKLKAGQISELDVEVSRTLSKLSKTLELKDAEFRKAFDLGDSIILLCSGKIGAMIGKGGKHIQEITKSLKKKAKVLEEGLESKRLCQEVLGNNTRITAINQTFKPEGTEYNIVVEEKHRNKVEKSQERIEKVLKELLKTPAKITYI